MNKTETTAQLLEWLDAEIKMQNEIPVPQAEPWITRHAERTKTLQSIRARLIAAEKMREAWEVIVKCGHAVHFEKYDHAGCDIKYCGIRQMREALTQWGEK